MALAVLWSAGCRQGAAEHPEPREAFEALRGRSAESPALRVGGRRLGIDEFRQYWSDHPTLEWEEVLERVVDRELAVRRAVARDLHERPEVARRRKRAIVRGLLRREVERRVTPDAVDADRVDEEVAKLRARLGRPAGIQASHLVVLPPKRDSKGDANGNAKEKSRGTPRARRTARTWARRIRRSLPEDPSATALFRARRAFVDRVPEGFRLSVDAHLRFPSPEARTFEGALPSRWVSVVDDFARAAHRLTGSDRAPPVSEPVESDYGWHLIVPERRLAEKVPDPEAAREVALARRLRERRRRRFEELWRKWKGRATIAVDPDKLRRPDRRRRPKE